MWCPTSGNSVDVDGDDPVLPCRVESRGGAMNTTSRGRWQNDDVGSDAIADC